MKKFFLVQVAVGLGITGAAQAAGTYYNRPYQSPQYSYGQPATQYAQPSYQSPYAPRPAQQFGQNAAPYGQTRQAQQPQQQQQQQSQPANARQEGFYLSGGISHEFANWSYEMKEAGSILHYDNLEWNVLDINGGYNFGTFKLDAGIKYGIQSGNSPMIDDDISNGGYWMDTLYIDTGGGNYELLGYIYGHALSAGTSSGGSMFGYHAGAGLTDLFTWGKAKMTPSIGYRSVSYKLTTKDNSGLSMQTGYCMVVPGTDEIQCNPLIMIDEDGDGIIDSILWDDNFTPEGWVFLGNTYMYWQPGASHKYNVSWAGPYLAMDVDYGINQYNSVDARFEFGLPAYKATGDQPYRSDWAHPKSVEDTGKIGDAYHFGMGANWNTSVSDSVMLSIGFTYDYYTVSNATAKTFLSSDYYLTQLQNQINVVYGGNEQAGIDAGDPIIIGVRTLMNECPNWVCSAQNEINSIYKSLGFRIGLNAKF
ncbi:MAG: hypothetical protein FWF97_04355 [Alphaproteobacteria bacterium]|nr:hypothetical protein [Alphaproteobacteria bacterium]